MPTHTRERAVADVHQMRNHHTDDGKHWEVCKLQQIEKPTNYDDPTWNLMGIGNNQVFRIKVHLDKVDGKHVVIF